VQLEVGQKALSARFDQIAASLPGEISEKLSVTLRDEFEVSGQVQPINRRDVSAMLQEGFDKMLEAIETANRGGTAAAREQIVSPEAEQLPNDGCPGAAWWTKLGAPKGLVVPRLTVRSAFISYYFGCRTDETIPYAVLDSKSFNDKMQVCYIFYYFKCIQ
jgi:hypothetical protein